MGRRLSACGDSINCMCVVFYKSNYYFKWSRIFILKAETPNPTQKNHNWSNNYSKSTHSCKKNANAFLTVRSRNKISSDKYQIHVNPVLRATIHQINPHPKQALTQQPHQLRLLLEVRAKSQHRTTEEVRMETQPVRTDRREETG